MLSIWLHLILFGIILFIIFFAINAKDLIFADRDSTDYVASLDMMKWTLFVVGVLFLAPFSIPTVIGLAVLKLCGYNIKIEKDKNGQVK